MGAASFPHTEAWGRTPLPWRFHTPTGQGGPWPEALGKQAGPLCTADGRGIRLSRPCKYPSGSGFLETQRLFGDERGSQPPDRD